MIRMICYDIAENKVRTRLVNLLEYQGFERIQYSVFVGSIEAGRWPKSWREIEEFYEKYCKPESDRINCHVIERDNFQEMFILGKDLDKDWILNEILVLFV